MKKYLLVNRKTGKTVRKASTRDEAREIKRVNGFKYSIVNTETMNVVR